MAFASFNSAIESLSVFVSGFQQSGASFSEFPLRFSGLRLLVCKAFRHWSVELISNVLFNCMVFLNPKLTPAQRSQLLLIMSRAMETFIQSGVVNQQLLRSIVTLASPDHGTSLLLNYLVEAFAAGLSPGGSTLQELQEDKDIAQVLVKDYGVDRVRVSAMPLSVRKAIVSSLGSEGFSTSSYSTSSSTGTSCSESSPVCCITLEPLLWPDCTLTGDVVAVVQGSRRGGKDHAFLYRGSALFDWLGRRQSPLNPETRSVINPSEIYRLS